MHFSLACVALLNNPIVSINLLELLQKIITMHAAVNMTLFISKLNILCTYLLMWLVGCNSAVVFTESSTTKVWLKSNFQ